MNSEAVDNYETGHSYTLDDALEVVGFGKFQALVMAYAGLGILSESVELLILSFIGPSVKAEWGLSSGQESLITTVVFAGMLVGSYLWGSMFDNYGRRVGLLSVALVSSLSAFISAISPNYISLLLFRMIVGVGLGGGPVYSSWFIEFVPVRNRGVCLVIFSAFWTVGSILEALLAWIVMPRLGWRWLLGLSSVPSFAAFIFYFYTIESPRYLCLNGRIADAHNILKKMAEINKTELPPGTLVTHQINGPHEEFIQSEDHTPLLSVNNPKPGSSSLFTLLSPSLLRTTLPMWVVFFGNAFVYVGVVLLIPELSSVQSKCGTVVLNPNKLTNSSSIYRNLFISSFAEVPGVVLSAAIVEKVGRKISMLLLYIFTIVFLLPLIFDRYELMTTYLLFGVRMCITGNYKIACIYCPEVYPTSVRATGVGVASAVGRAAGMICPLVAVDLVSCCHQTTAIGIFEVIVVLSGISVLLFPVETKGRKLIDTVAVK